MWGGVDLPAGKGDYRRRSSGSTRGRQQSYARRPTTSRSASGRSARPAPRSSARSRAQREREVLSKKTQKSRKAAGKGAILILAISLIAIKAFSSLPSTTKTSSDKTVGITKAAPTTTTTFANSESSTPPVNGSGAAGASVSPDQVVLPQITPAKTPSSNKSAPPSSAPRSSSTIAKVSGGSSLGASSPNASVTVRVFNGTDVGGAAGKLTNQLGKLGYDIASATNATTQNISTTVIYFSPGYQSQAVKLATAIGLASSAIKQFSFAAPIPAVQPSDLNVVLGTDKAG